MSGFCLAVKLEEEAMKWKDRPSATEMNRGSAYEMDRQTKRHTNGNATEMYKFRQDFWER